MADDLPVCVLLVDPETGEYRPASPEEIRRMQAVPQDHE